MRLLLQLLLLMLLGRFAAPSDVRVEVRPELFRLTISVRFVDDCFDFARAAWEAAMTDAVRRPSRSVCGGLSTKLVNGMVKFGEILLRPVERTVASGSEGDGAGLNSVPT